MKIFISWSGDASRDIARQLRGWLPLVLDDAEPFVSSEDIKLGSHWGSEVAQQLKDTNFGVILVTPANLNSPWLMFEAGAIGKAVDHARVVPVLIGVSKDDISGPLALFQSVEWSESGVLSLLKAIDDATQRPVDPLRLTERFASLWPMLQRQVAAVPVDEDESSPMLSLLGPAAAKEPVRLVFPRFKFTEQVMAKLQELATDQSVPYLYDKPQQRRGGAGKELIEPVAANDLRALCTVAETLGSQGVPIHPMTDAEARNARGRFPLVSFGMTSSDVTMMYFDLCAASRRPPLFLSLDLPDGRAVVRLANGRELPYEGEAGEADAYGLLARVTPSSRDAGRKWLFCAGLGRSGTEAAANYLSDNWRDLATVVGERDFVTVVRCPSGKPEVVYSDDEDTVFAD